MKRMRKKVIIFYKGEELDLIETSFFVADRGYNFRRGKRDGIIEKPDESKPNYNLVYYS